MKKLILTIIILLFTLPCWGATETFYMCHGGDGTLPETAICATAYDEADFNTAGNWDTDDADDGKIGPNDEVLLLDDGGAFNTKLIVQTEGLSGKNIVIKNGTGESPVVDCRAALTAWDTSGNWTQDGAADRWYIDSSGMTYSNPGRMWFTKIGDSGLTEGQEVVDAASVDAEYEWYYDSGNTNIYVYSTSNPASYFADMKGLVANQYALQVYDKDYLEITGISFYGGNSASVCMREVQYVYFHDNTVSYGEKGIAIYGKVTANYDVYSRVYIYNNTIDSGYVLDNSNAIVALSDGISLFEGCQYSEIYSNTVKNWGHTGITLGGWDITKWPVFASDNIVRDNDVSAPDLDYGRGFEIFGTAARSQNNLVYRNNFHDLSVRIQFNGNDNTFYSNTVANVTNPTRTGSTTRGQGIRLNTWTYNANTLVSYNNKVLNNTFFDTDEAGIDLANDLDTSDVYGHTIQNNIILNCGDDSIASQYGLMVKDDTDINNNTISNNDIYSSTRGAGNEVSYRGTAMTVATFNTSDAESDTIASNIQSDPKLISATDLHLLVSSPCIDAGADLTATVTTDIDSQSSTHANMAGNLAIGADFVKYLVVLTGAATLKYSTIDGEDGNYAGIFLDGGQTINDITVARCVSGALSVTGNVTIENGIFDDEVYIDSGVTLTANNCFFQEAEATIAVDGTITDTDCVFSIIDFGFQNKANGNLCLKRESSLIGKGKNTGADTDGEGQTVPYQGTYEPGYAEYTRWGDCARHSDWVRGRDKMGMNMR